MSEDHRKEKRFPVAATVPLWTGDTAIECPASDISSHGIFLEMAAPLRGDTFVKIGPANSRYPARVVFVLSPESAATMGRNPGVGLQITEPIDPDAFLLACAEDAAAARAAAARAALAASAAAAAAAAKNAPAAIDLPASIAFEAPPKTRIATVVAPPPPPAAFVPLPGQSMPGGGFQAPAKSNVSNRPAGARRIVEVAATAGTGAATGVRDSDVREGARDRAREPNKTSVVNLEVVTLDDGSPAHASLVRALVADDYAPLAARHGLEALVLILRKGPVLAIVPETARGLPGRIIIDEVRKRRELDGTALILLDASDAPDPTSSRVARWRDVPDDLARVRGAIDRLLGETGAVPATRPPATDARALADAMAALGHSLEDRGMLDEASAALRYAGELAPTVTTHALRLARLLLARGGAPRVDEAAALVERSIRLEPLSVEALVLRALIVDGRGNTELARQTLKRAQMLAPQHAEVIELLARVAAGLPLEDRAARVTDAASNDAERKGALGRLRKLFN